MLGISAMFMCALKCCKRDGIETKLLRKLLRKVSHAILVVVLKYILKRHLKTLHIGQEKDYQLQKN